MSVSECGRNGCDYIMPERCSETYGYLCWECFDELVALGPNANVSDFMSSPKKGNRSSREKVAKARFEAEFPKKVG